MDESDLIVGNKYTVDDEVVTVLRKSQHHAGYWVVRGERGFTFAARCEELRCEKTEAAREALERGMAFLVDGRHVPAERIEIISPAEGTGPIAEMRKAKIDAQAALKDMEAFAANVSKPMNKAHVAMTGQHIRQLLDACMLEKRPHWDDTYLGMHSYIMMSDIEDRVRGLVSEMNVLIAAHKHEASRVGARLRRVCKLTKVPMPAGDDTELMKYAFGLLTSVCIAVEMKS